MYIDKKHRPIFLVNFISIVFFAEIFLFARNSEFIIYLAVILFFFILVLLSYKKVKYTTNALCGLTVWSILHMSGGALYFRGVRLYDYMVFPVLERYQVLRYDQIVHVLGFAVATYVFYLVLKKHLIETDGFGLGVGIIVVLVGLGAGALNEVIEFIVSQSFDAGVGGYINTSIDLVSNLFGSVFAMLLIKFKILK